MGADFMPANVHHRPGQGKHRRCQGTKARPLTAVRCGMLRAPRNPSIDEHMFGALRFLLSVLVAMSHLIEHPFFQQFGRFAVFGFYVISGYLMTRVLNEVYRFDLMRFSTNRALRIYPSYLIVLLASWMVAYCFPDEAKSFSPQWHMGRTLNEMAANVLIFPLATTVEATLNAPRIILPAWSIAVELQCYAVLAIFAARSKRLAIVTLIASVAWHGAIVLMKLKGNSSLTFDHIYFPLPAAMLPFSVGALVYFFRDRLSAALRSWRIDLAVALWFGHLLISHQASEAFKGATFVVFYVNLALITLVVALLMNRRTNKLDTWLGDLAYPVFLTHCLVHFLVHFLGKDAKPWPADSTVLDLCASMALTLLASFALVKLGNGLVEPLRSRVRQLGGGAAPECRGLS
jgi:peptidoglycan/LPS O-acetylase OafA/YrhL